ncbi:hypothetical protein EDF46_1580 [Frondihabitans sp. PhB188]|uniref:hypothetical protein n=1 Tax=Frondihabitans sp. PhB188 TaxID=2485200 RepID=UPI000F493AB1|nr:hypothetical protein [Frondihabitans sp. PhB188]ROQ39945.1 hypothetical protein EDF46_1580 [Frondihabitans sp. PhB188]
MSIPTPDRPLDERLPDGAVATTRLAGRYPGRHHPRKGDLVATVVFTAILYFIAVVYEITGAARAAEPQYSVDGTALANTLTIAVPIILAVFATVFSALFVLRRVPTFWLPIVAAILIVALYSVTEDMLDSAVLGSLTP